MRATGKSKMKVALMERVEISFCDVAFVILKLEFHHFDGGNRRCSGGLSYVGHWIDSFHAQTHFLTVPALFTFI